MDNNLTLNSHAFNFVYSTKEGSMRRNTTRGANLPTELTIRHRDIIDSKTKRASRQSVARFDYHVELSDGTIGVQEFHLVSTTPKDTAITSTEILANLEYMVGLIQEDDSGLNLGSEIYVDARQ